MNLQSDSVFCFVVLTASEASESESDPEEDLLDAFECDGDFTAATIQLLGLAPGRIPPPTLATDFEPDDREAEEIRRCV